MQLLMTSPKDMSRAEVRALKRIQRQALREDQGARAAECAALLLQRSIEMGHRRLAVQRFHRAAQLGASLSPAQIMYCEQAMRASANAKLRSLFKTALQDREPMGDSDLPRS